ncbi:MAG: hypothetical protein Q9161_002158 [Pseudevernia consocians]
MHFSTLFTLFLAAAAPVAVFSAPAEGPPGPPPSGVSFHGPHGTGFPGDHHGPHGTGVPPMPTGTFSGPPPEFKSS